MWSTHSIYSNVAFFPSEKPPVDKAFQTAFNFVVTLAISFVKSAMPFLFRWGRRLDE